jgi:thioredoxin 1
VSEGEAMSEERVIELSDGNFDEEVFGHKMPVVVEFWSEGSYACRELADIIDDLASEYEGKILVGRVDLDANWQTAEAYNVKSVPTVLLFQHDRLVDRIEGAKNRSEYRQAVNELVAQYWEI